MKQTATAQVNSTKVALLEAAREVLMAEGYSGLSTRAIAVAANTQMSQIRYHFGSKEGMVLALYEYMTEQLIERQTDLFSDPDISLSKKWDVACDYLDTDIESGYVRVLQELMAVGWSNPKIAQKVRASLNTLFDLHLQLARDFQQAMGSFAPFEPIDIAALIVPAFIGSEALLLLGPEEQIPPVRQALRRFGNIIRHFENSDGKREL